MRRLAIFIIFSIGLSLLSSCGVGQKIKDFHKPVDLRKEPLDPDERARRNIEEGRGISLGNITTVDYSGGMIITDWYSDNSNNNESLKISVRFLSNEIRSDSLKIMIHKKDCRISDNCGVSLLPKNSKLNSELLTVILRKASLLEQSSKKKPVKK